MTAAQRKCPENFMRRILAAYANIRSMCEIAARRSAMTRNADSFAAKSLGEAERHRRANKASADLILAAQPHVEKALAVGEKSIAELLAMLAGPTVELSDMQLVEFRTKLSGMPKQDRVRAIIWSIEKGSDQLAAAMLGCDRFLRRIFYRTLSFPQSGRHGRERVIRTKSRFSRSANRTSPI